MNEFSEGVCSSSDGWILKQSNKKCLENKQNETCLSRIQVI